MQGEVVQPQLERDWRVQMRKRLRTVRDLEEFIDLTGDERRAIEITGDVFRWSITPYYASLMSRFDPDCPVRRQVVPRTDEMAPDIVGVVDPLDETGHSPVKNLIHNYPGKVAFCVTSECAIYCRYCLRKRMVGDSSFMMKKDELQAAIDYIASRPEIRDVLLTGGDPLILGDNQLAWILEKLRAISHVEIIRIGSRLPVVNPFRITDELCNLLAEHHPVWLNTHFNHPKELTPDVAAAADRLSRAGVPIGNQTVLLKGINDNIRTMTALVEGLVALRIRPYYIYHAQLIGGTAHFRTSVESGMALMKQLRGHTSGFAVPQYVLDTPHGKIPLTRDYVLGRAGDYVVMESTRGKLWAEPNPLHPEDNVPLRLPQIELPADIDTIPTGAPKFVYADGCGVE